MITIEQIIEAEFEGARLDEIVQQLSEHRLYSPIIRTITQVNGHIDDIDKELRKHGTLQVTHIATTLLIQVNDYLKGFDNRRAKERKKLKHLVGCICKRLLILIADEHPDTHKKLFIESFMNALRETCEFKKYKFQELVAFLGLDTLAYQKWVEKEGQDIVIPSVEVTEIFPGYVWNDKTGEGYTRFIEIIEELNICPEPQRFKLLFDNPMENLAIELNRSNPSFVIQFFSCVWDSRRVTYQGCDGFYKVLQIHVRDFDTVFLKRKLPKRRVAVVREHKSFQKNKDRFDALLKQCLKPVP